MSVIDQARERCQSFANTHKVVFEDRGEVGFGRDCVGFIRGSEYIDISPDRYVFTLGSLNPDIVPIDELSDRRLEAPVTVEDAYHKHNCLAVLVHDDDYDTAILQLADWVNHLEQIGVEVVTYETGRQGIHLMIGGPIGYAICAFDRKAVETV